MKKGNVAGVEFTKLDLKGCVVLLLALSKKMRDHDPLH